LMSAIGRGSFLWGEKALNTENTPEDRQISKLISESWHPRCIAQSFSSRHCLNHRHCSVSGILYPYSSSSFGISWLEMSPPQIERWSETNKGTICCLAAGRAWEATAEELDRVLHWRWVLRVME
jgi:hypothetical protein